MVYFLRFKSELGSYLSLPYPFEAAGDLEFLEQVSGDPLWRALSRSQFHACVCGVQCFPLDSCGLAAPADS